MMNLESEAQRLSMKVAPLQRFVHLLADQLDHPRLFVGLDERGFRYLKPTYKHFILLRSCRMVSALNASISLARAGYVQEIGVVLRTAIEYYTQIEYVLLHRDDAGEPTGKAARFIVSFFEDNRRTAALSSKKPFKLNQADVHDAVGKNLDEFGPEETGRKPATELLSHVYIVFSNYVHGRYPESMDLFGGRPGHYHLGGMRGTPKDAENIEVIDTLITSVSNCLVQVVQGLRLYEVISRDDILIDWYKRAIERGGP